MFGRTDRRCLLVLSHPNHEAAIFGLIQRVRPTVVILTDGGGEQRVAQSRRGLERIGLLDRTSILGWREADFYGALLDGNVEFFRAVALRVRREIEAIEPEEVLCDAVEFYNPVHDLSLPIVRAALNGEGDIAVFEAPLIYQKGGSPESYEIQRFPASRGDGQIVVHLNEEELAHKLWARDEGYESLRQQVGPLLRDLPAEHFATEVVGPAADTLPKPGNDQTLRYDWRARLLLERGQVKGAITHADHYVPVATSLLADTRVRLPPQVGRGRV